MILVSQHRKCTGITCKLTNLLTLSIQFKTKVLERWRSLLSFSVLLWFGSHRGPPKHLPWRLGPHVAVCRGWNFGWWLAREGSGLMTVCYIYGWFCFKWPLPACSAVSCHGTSLHHNPKQHGQVTVDWCLWKSKCITIMYRLLMTTLIYDK